MQDLPKKMVIGSVIVAGIVALLALTDLILGIPFSGTEHTRVMDILFIIAAAIVGYLGWEAYKELS
jgi:hypothetical protein